MHCGLPPGGVKNRSLPYKFRRGIQGTPLNAAFCGAFVSAGECETA